VAAVPGVERLRYTTSHPRDMDEDVFRAHQELPALCNHLHLPVQSGSDRVLKRMGRRYTRARYLEVAEALRSTRAGFALSSDFIVGFPGETEEDFEQTLSLMRAAPIVMSFSFKFSPRPGTAATRLREKVPEEVAADRLTRLQRQQRALSLEWHQAMVGTEVEVLVEGPSRHDAGVVCGRTTTNAMVNFPGSLDLVGRTVRVRVTEGFTHSCRAYRR